MDATTASAICFGMRQSLDDHFSRVKDEVFPTFGGSNGSFSSTVASEGIAGVDSSSWSSFSFVDAKPAPNVAGSRSFEERRASFMLPAEDVLDREGLGGGVALMPDNMFNAFIMIAMPYGSGVSSGWTSARGLRAVLRAQGNPIPLVEAQTWEGGGVVTR